MKQTGKLHFIITLLLSSNISFAQWTKITSIPSNDIVALSVNNNILYAASDSSVIYESTDSGIVWTPITVSNNPIDITAIIFFNSKIYIGTFTHGVFYRSIIGSTWQNNGANLAISDFAVRNNILYASTLGNGVAVLNSGTNTWSLMNDSLPSYSVNVESIIGPPGFLMIAAGANGTFYKYNFNIHGWEEGYYYGILRPGLQIDNLINNDDTIFAINGNRIIKSSDAGGNWTDDKSGTHNGFSRYIYEGLSNHYTLTNVIPAGTWIQQRNKHANINDSWATDEEFLPVGYSYAIIEFNNKLFLGKDDGLYVKSIAPRLNLSGVILTEKGTPVPGVTVTLSGDDNQTSITAADGQYRLSVTQGGNYIVTPSRNNDITTNNGITAADILNVRRQILNIQPLGLPYRIIAADVDASSSVSTTDILYIRSVILQTTTTFPNGQLWSFVPADYIFADSLHPFPFPSARTFTNIQQSIINQDFIGIKLGDVNDSWDATIP